jgi:hypothetical protein
MNCRECLDLLDGLEPGAPVPEGCRKHAASCPACTLALRIEGTLREAPEWAKQTRLALETRADLLGQARIGRLFWRQAGGLFEESAVTALTVLSVIAGLVILWPKLSATLVPQPVRRSAAEYLGPAAGYLSGLLAPLAPLIREPWGLALTAVALFSILMAAVLSAKALLPAPQFR